MVDVFHLAKKLYGKTEEIVFIDYISDLELEG